MRAQLVKGVTLAELAREFAESDFEKYKDDLARAEVEFSHAGQDAELAGESLEFEVRTRELEMERQQLVLDNLARRVDELTVYWPRGGTTRVRDVLANQRLSIVEPEGPRVPDRSDRSSRR